MAKAKGSTLDGAIRFLLLERATAERRLPEALRHYLDEGVSIAAWYPETDLLGLVRVITDMLPGDRAQILREMGRITAREHLEGAYAHLIEGGHTRNLSIRAQTLWSAMHDTGRLRVERQGPGRLRLELSEYALPSEELCGITGGYLDEMLRLNGVLCEIEKHDCAAQGDASCTWLLTWDPDA